MKDIQEESILALGFKGQTLTEFKNVSKNFFSIANDPQADITWNDFYYLQTQIEVPRFDESFFNLLANIKKNYYQFVDIYSRRYFYATASSAEIYNTFILFFYACLKIVKDKKISCIVFSNIPHEGYDYIFYLIAKELNIKTILCNQSLFPNRFWISSEIDAFGNFQNQPNLNAFEPSHYVLPKPNQWVNMQGRMEDYSYSTVNFLKECLKKPYRLPVALLRYFNAFQYRKEMSALTVQPDSDEQFIYFPLHLQPELTTSALGGEFSDQITAIEALSQMLPENVYVYVKENPKQTEANRGKLFFRRIRHLKNVRFVSRFYNSTELINRSIAVAVINGTAGWESLFLNKPVLTFGYAWFESFRGVTRYRPGIQLHEVLQSTPPNISETVDFLDQLLMKTGIGVVDDDYIGIVQDFNHQENAKRVLQSIMKYYRES